MMDKYIVKRVIWPAFVAATSTNSAPLLMASMMMTIIAMIASAANGFG